MPLSSRNADFDYDDLHLSQVESSTKRRTIFGLVEDYGKFLPHAFGFATAAMLLLIPEFMSLPLALTYGVLADSLIYGDELKFKSIEGPVVLILQALGVSACRALKVLSSTVHFTPLHPMLSPLHKILKVQDRQIPARMENLVVQVLQFIYVDIYLPHLYVASSSYDLQPLVPILKKTYKWFCRIAPKEHTVGSYAAAMSTALSDVWLLLSYLGEIRKSAPAEHINTDFDHAVATSRAGMAWVWYPPTDPVPEG